MNPRIPALFAPYALTFLLLGCASGYRAGKPETFEYKVAEGVSGVEFKYMYDVLQFSRNPRYAAKAARAGVDVVAVKLKNNTDHEIDVGKDLEFTVGEAPAVPLAPERALARVRQSTAGYALWFMIAPLNIFGSSTSCSNYDCDTETTFIPVGIILGPAIAVGNMARSSASNDAFMKEFSGKDASRQKIPPGGSYEGYLVFKDIEQAPIRAKLRI